jgi:hypothetical protein
MAKRKSKISVRENTISDEEKQYQFAFDFAYWLENNLGKASVGGAIQLLRKFIMEKNSKNET